MKTIRNNFKYRNPQTGNFESLPALGISGGVHVGKNPPTDGMTNVWVDTKDQGYCNIPVIDDNAVSTEDTWSSQKIKNSISNATYTNNLLDNSYFVSPVNNKGQTNYTTVGETIDRWILQNSGGLGISLSDTGLVINATSKFVFVQEVKKEIRKNLIGKTVTAVAKTSDGNIWFSSGVVPEFGVGIDSPQKDLNGLKLNIFCEPTDDTLFIRLFSFSISTPIIVESIALYEGEYTAETLPPYVYKGYEQELLACQNYYSTNEQLTGKYWIDGKPIYRQVFTGASAQTAAAPNTIGTIANLDTVVSMNGYCLKGDGNRLPLNWYYDGNNRVDSYVDQLGNVVSRTSYANTTCTMTVEYTKTID